MNTAWKIISVIVLITMVVLVARFVSRDDSSTKTITKMFFVKKGDIEKVVRGTGVLKSPKRAEIVSEIKGAIKKIHVSEGDEVRKDDALAEIENTEIDNEIKGQSALVENLEKDLDELKKDVEEQTAVMSAKLAWEQAKSDYDFRKKELVDEQSRIEQGIPKYSKDELEKLKKDVESLRKKTVLAEKKYEEAKPTEADIREAESKHEKEKEKLSKLEEAAEGRVVTSPIDGTVLTVYIDKEALDIEPDREYDVGTSLFLVADLSSIVVEGMVFESDINKLKENQRVKVFLSQQSRIWNKAKLKKISLTPGKDPGKFDIRINFDQPPKNVKEGVRVDFQIVVDEREKVLVVPIEFVRKVKGRSYVVVREESGDSEREIQLGISDDHNYHVIEGLEKDEKVVLKISSAQ